MNVKKPLIKGIALALCAGLGLPTLAENKKVIGSVSSIPVNNVDDFIADEIFQAFEDKNKFAEALDLDFEFELDDDWNIKNKYSRRIYTQHKTLDELGNPSSIDGSPKFESNHMLVNAIRSQLNGSIGGGDTAMSSHLGFYFSVAKAVRPVDVLESDAKTDMLKYLDPNELNLLNLPSDLSEDQQPKIKEFLRQLDSSGTINFFKKIANTVLVFFEGIIRKVSDVFNDSEAMRTYMQQPLEAFKLHMKYGFPIDVNIFEQTDDRLSVGDSIKHMTYLAYTPISKEIGGNNALNSTVSLSGNLLSSVILEKGANNRVLAEFKLAQSGSFNSVFGRIKKSLGIGFLKFSFNILDWYYTNNFHNVVFTETFLFDLNNPKAKELLRKTIKRGYILKLPKDPDKSKDGDTGVISLDDQYSDSLTDGQYNFLVGLPEIFKYENRKIFSANLVKTKLQNKKRLYEFVGSKVHSIDSKVLSILEEINKDWRKDYHARTHISLISDLAAVDLETNDYNVNSNLLLNVPTYYTNTKTQQKTLDRITRALYNILGENVLKPEHIKTLNRYKANDSFLNLSYNIALNKSHIEQLLNNMRDVNKNKKMWQFFAEMYLGDQGKNAWVDYEARKHWNTWISNDAQTINDNHTSAAQAEVLPYNCSSAGPGIFTNNEGIVAPNHTKILHQDSDPELCISFYKQVNGFMSYLEKMAGIEHKSYLHFVSPEKEKGSHGFYKLHPLQFDYDALTTFKKFLSVYPPLQFTPAIQAFLIKFVPNASVTYNIDLDAKVQLKGKRGTLPTYPHRRLTQLVKDPDQVDHSNSRILEMSVLVDTERYSREHEKKKGKAPKGKTPQIEVTVKTSIPLKTKDLVAKIQIREFLMLKDRKLGRTLFYVEPKIKPVLDKVNTYRIEIPWDDNLDGLKNDDKYTMTLVFTNKDLGNLHWVTEQKEVLFKMPKFECFNTANPNDDHCFDKGGFISGLANGIFY